MLLTLAVLPFLVATAVGLVLLWPRQVPTALPGELGVGTQLVDGTVAKVQGVPCQEFEQLGDRRGCQIVTVRLTTGPDKGGETLLEVTGGPDQPELVKGSKLVLGRSTDGGDVTYFFSDFQRRTPLLWLAGLFAVVVIGIGRWRGVTSIIGVAFTFALLLKFVLPAILEGSSPLLVSIVGAAAAMFMILYLAHGFSAKTTAALLGTLVSLALTAGLAAVFVAATKLLNVGGDETAFLQLSAAQVDLQGLLLGGIIIGSLGVLNDVTVTQASAVWALGEADPGLGFKGLYRRAMEVGRDHIASTVDTLVLAYAGASLPLLLLFTLASRSVAEVVTGSLVAEELVRTLVGGIGLAASVPITTALASLAMSRRATSGAGGTRRLTEPIPVDDLPELDA
ncbi:MAG: YibE/F family protein [Acidimicrobiales bacterium]